MWSSCSVGSTGRDRGEARIVLNPSPFSKGKTAELDVRHQLLLAHVNQIEASRSNGARSKGPDVRYRVP